MYYWNTNLNKIVTKKIKFKYQDKVIIAIGGPSIDTDKDEQKKMFEKIPGADVIIPNEGEQGFVNLIKRYLSGKSDLFDWPIDGAVFKKKGELISGAEAGFLPDLSVIPSPYLNGLMDDFLDGDYQPLVQTSRGCPYTCAFCVSGKSRCKIRLFSIEQVKEEISFVARVFADRPHFRLFITDENFGLTPRDSLIAKHIKKCATDLKYPKHVFFYTDKKFTKTSAEILQNLGDINDNGLVISLQSENPDVLQAAHRANLKSEEVDAAIAWAAARGIYTTTELIFGLPFETRESFIELLEKSAKRGFDSLLCYNLFLMDGIELNREVYRKKYHLTTKFRLIGSNYGYLDGDFSAETEEVVVASSHFSFEDFEIIRCLNLLFYAIYTLDFYKWLFHLIINMKISLIDFIVAFTNPDTGVSWPAGYLKFIADFKNAFRAELFNSPLAASHAARSLYIRSGDQVGEPTKLNVLFGARLIYLENSWVDEVLRKLLEKFIDLEKDELKAKLVNCILDLCRQERIDLSAVNQKIAPMTIEYDLVGWKSDKFRTDIFAQAIKAKKLRFNLDQNIETQIRAFNKDFKQTKGIEYYYNALDYIHRSDLVYKVSYEK